MFRSALAFSFTSSLFSCSTQFFPQRFRSWLPLWHCKWPNFLGRARRKRRLARLSQCSSRRSEANRPNYPALSQGPEEPPSAAEIIPQTTHVVRPHPLEAETPSTVQLEYSKILQQVSRHIGRCGQRPASPLLAPRECTHHTKTA